MQYNKNIQASITDWGVGATILNVCKNESSYPIGHSGYKKQDVR